MNQIRPFNASGRRQAASRGQHALATTGAVVPAEGGGEALIWLLAPTHTESIRSKDIRDKARAIEVYARQARNVEAERRACEIRLRAERRCGQLAGTNQLASWYALGDVTRTARRSTRRNPPNSYARHRRALRAAITENM